MSKHVPTLKEIEEETGVDQSLMSRICSDKRRMTFRTAKRVAPMFGMSPVELMVTVDQCQKSKFAGDMAKEFMSLKKSHRSELSANTRTVDGETYDDRDLIDLWFTENLQGIMESRKRKPGVNGGGMSYPKPPAIVLKNTREVKTNEDGMPIPPSILKGDDSVLEDRGNHDD